MNNMCSHFIKIYFSFGSLFQQSSNLFCCSALQLVKKNDIDRHVTSVKPSDTFNMLQRPTAT